MPPIWAGAAKSARRQQVAGRRLATCRTRCPELGLFAELVWAPHTKGPHKGGLDGPQSVTGAQVS